MCSMLTLTQKKKAFTLFYPSKMVKIKKSKIITHTGIYMFLPVYSLFKNVCTKMHACTWFKHAWF